MNQQERDERENYVFQMVVKPDADAVFALTRVRYVQVPHPYCITPKHIAVAAQFGGMLTPDTIRAAEKQGAVCHECRFGRRTRLSYDEHENVLTAFIEVSQNKDLNAVPGLHAYLLKVKEQKLGIDGFAFPIKLSSGGTK